MQYHWEKGDVRDRLADGGMWVLKEVRHVPDLRKNLISVSQLASSGYLTTFSDASWKVSKGAIVVASSRREGTLYITASHSDETRVAEKCGDTSPTGLEHMGEMTVKYLHDKERLTDLVATDLVLSNLEEV